MKVLLTGGQGMLGRALQQQWKDIFEVVPYDHPGADITDARSFNEILRSNTPDVVVHCAAMTAVDRCEADPDTAFQVNALGTANVASACRRHDVRLLAISTDYVFDGKGKRAYSEFDMPTGGVNVYGQSKFAGEQAVRTHCPGHVIARVSWLYGPGGPSFVHTMMRLADGSRPTLKVVNDQCGNPTSTTAVAHALKEIIERPFLEGTFHVTCEGEATWYEFAREIFRLAGKNQKVEPCTSSDYPTPARRPANSRLEKRMLKLEKLSPMPHWKDALAEFMRREFPRA